MKARRTIHSNHVFSLQGGNEDNDLWVTGALFTLISILAKGIDTGWTFYTPYSIESQTSVIWMAPRTALPWPARATSSATACSSVRG